MAFNQQTFDFDCSIPSKFNKLSSCFTTRYTYLIHHIYEVVTMELFLGSSLNQEICIRCQNHNTPLYWECVGPTSHVPMQPTNKHLRISYVHEVNNIMTQLSSISHTFKQHKKCSAIFQIVTLIAKRHMCLQTCSLAMIRLLQVEYSSWWIVSTSLPFHTCLLFQRVCSKPPHLTLAYMVRRRLFLRSGVYIGVLTYGKFLQILFLPWVKGMGYVCNNE